MPSRRSVLSAAGVALSSGCLGTWGGSPLGDGCVSGFSVHGRPFDPAGELPLILSAGQRSLVERLVDDHPAEISTYFGDPPIRGGVFVEHRGTFYEVSAEEIGRTEVPARLLELSWNAGQTAPGDARTVHFEELPRPDRRVVRLVVEGPEYGGQEGHPSEGMTVSEFPAPYPDGVADSTLVGAGETYVRWNDRTYLVEVGGEATTSRYTYRYDIAAVADGPDAFRSVVADRFLVALADPSEPVADILAAATGDGYQECEPASEGLRQLRQQLPAEKELPHPRDGAWYVAFEGDRYELGIIDWIK